MPSPPRVVHLRITMLLGLFLLLAMLQKAILPSLLTVRIRGRQAEVPAADGKSTWTKVYICIGVGIAAVAAGTAALLMSGHGT